ncbi:regulatory protein [Caminicella sporogenes DSM 14501]|uniref:Regulatory protein RecX n=1 Tax=Caminicella sporogenes DSM 14501 TaxID=1121266 RepID=A0A1M6NY79_9FIRM|nr:RecX family transcriptional regulator [Caminicella sporogenes]RKD21601.1 hypothetical protein BET04_07730 [Caminicella sporogenes]WIF94115.1 RecX family transcriptional regulator [Caminicella sporogenes]SHK00600.1 regulatory protein [Caminicella sporogenes DSM 14501]
MDGNICKITKIEIQKKNKDRVSIYINGQYGFGIHKEIFFKYDFEEGKILDKKFIEEIIKEEEQKRANSYALKLLSYRLRSEKEIKDKMNLKGYDAEVIDKTVKYLKEYNYINDFEFTNEFVREKLNKFGKKRIKLELINKGINEDIIDSVLNKEIDDDLEYEKALELAKKKLKVYGQDDKNGVYRKLGLYLQRKGYNYRIITKILKEIL